MADTTNTEYNWLAVTATPVPLTSNQSITLTVSAKVGILPSNLFSGTITISGNASNSPQKLNVSFLLNCPAIKSSFKFQADPLATGPPTLTSLDQTIAARDTPLRLNINGANLSCADVP